MSLKNNLKLLWLLILPVLFFASPTAHATPADCRFDTANTNVVYSADSGLLDYSVVVLNSTGGSLADCEGLTVVASIDGTTIENTAIPSSGTFSGEQNLGQPAGTYAVDLNLYLPSDSTTAIDTYQLTYVVPPSTEPVTGSYWSDAKVAQWVGIGIAFFITGWFAYQFRFTRYD